MVAIVIGRVLLGCLIAGVAGGCVALVLTGISLEATNRGLNRLDERRARRHKPFVPYIVPPDNWSKNDRPRRPHQDRADRRRPAPPH